MEDSDDFGAVLKQLDELDAIDYTPKLSYSIHNTKEMATTQGPADDSNISDFDNSDEDLASLLDDDDDIFAKKIYGNSPLKTSSKVTPPGVKTNIQSKISSPSHSLESPSRSITGHLKAKDSKKDDFDDDIFDDFIEPNLSKTAPDDLKTFSLEKDKAKSSNHPGEETDFLDDLGLSQFSPSKDFSSSTPSLKKSKSIDKKTENSPDILNDFISADKDFSKKSKERRGSFFDDFLQKLSPTHTEKKTNASSISEEKVKDSEEDILGAYIPTAPKKSEITSDSTKSPKRRGSLHKQVSFKDIADDFSETDVIPSKVTASLEEKSLKHPSSSKKSENNIQIKRTEKTRTNKTEDMDWLNFFKDSPKKTPKVPETKKKDPELPASKPKPSFKRQSSGDWLGLSESGVLNKEDSGGKIKEEEINVTSLSSSRPKTANSPIIRPHQQDIKKTINDWNDGDDIMNNFSQSKKSDLSQILKTTETDFSDRSDITNSILAKGSIEAEIIGPSSSKIKKDIRKGSNTAPKLQRLDNESLSDNFISNAGVVIRDSTPKADFDGFQSRNILQSHEQTTALHSMQLMLDDSIKERNKLIKDNENMRIMYEENIKAAEEFHKSEKKMLEDSIKTLELSLKTECDIKIKSLEERLNSLSEEKKIQAKNFEEKFQNSQKEYQIEIQRLKDLHSQAISVMKEDHEEALLRLKKLKEQEIEAVLSTQVHSKSLQYLSDQLEARAKELASLQNKIEERSQTTLKDKQALLDAKERDLKALQNRLQKQLDDTEDERTTLQQLVLRLESRLQKMTMDGEEDHWEVQQMKAKLTIQQKYLEEEQKLNQLQIEKEKEKLQLSQNSLLQEQKTVLLQLAQERQQLTQEKLDMQSLAKKIKEEEAKLNVRKLKEESSLEAEKQFLQEEKNKLHFEKEKIKQEFYQLERERDSLQRDKQQLKNERVVLNELEMSLKRKAVEVEEMTSAAAEEREKGQHELNIALAMKKEQQLKMQQYTKQMKLLMDKEHHILSEREKFITEKIEFEQSKNSVLCTKCKLSLDNTVQASPTGMNMPIVFPLPTTNGLSNQVQPTLLDPNLVIWHITAQKDRQFLQEELAFLKSLKDSSKRKNSK